MELKIRIKEVKEEWKQLTELETLLTDLSRLNQVPESYKDKLKEQLKLRGIMGYDISSDRILGHFRTETIRDATPEEVIAWHCIGIWASCSDDGKQCKTCAKNCGCEDGDNYSCRNGNNMDIAKELLKNKEVILELV